MMNRFIFDNLTYKLNDRDVMLLNLTSYRRKIVTRKMIDKLCVIETKINQGCELTENENQLYRQLRKSKQILSKDIEEQVSTILAKEAVLDLNKIPVRSITLNLTHKCNFNCYYCYQNVRMKVLTGLFKKHDKQAIDMDAKASFLLKEKNWRALSDEEILYLTEYAKGIEGECL